VRKIPIKPGDRFGRGVTIEEIRYPPSPSSAARGYSGPLGWRLRCDCGNEYRAKVSPLRKGQIRSCGCLRNELSAARMAAQHADPEWAQHTAQRAREGQLIHGLSPEHSPNHRNYKRWREMVARCHDPTNHAYRLYGARGIAVCEQWRTDPVAFCAWIDENLGPCPERHSLDRIDNNGDYEPGNIRWAPAAIQAINRRATHWYDHDGRSQTLQQWSREIGVNEANLRYHLKTGKTMTEIIAFYAGKGLP
jgi:hypothetical protein